MTNVSIIIPLHNEEKNLPLLINDLLKLKLKNHEIIIVDDNSIDKTAEIADLFSNKYKHVKALHRKTNPGMGAALRDGTRVANGKVVVWVMGDRSDDLRTIRRMIAKVEAGADLVIGSRYTKGGSRGNLDVGKAVLSFGFTFLSRLLFGVPIHDITNAFRAFRKEVFLKCNPRSDDFAISPEFALLAHKNKFKLAEVPTTYYNRLAGKSNFRMLKMGMRYTKTMVSILLK